MLIYLFTQRTRADVAEIPPANNSTPIGYAALKLKSVESKLKLAAKYASRVDAILWFKQWPLRSVSKWMKPKHRIQNKLSKRDMFSLENFKWTKIGWKGQKFHSQEENLTTCGRHIFHYGPTGGGEKKLIIHRWNSFGEYHNSPTVISLLLRPGQDENEERGPRFQREKKKRPPEFDVGESEKYLNAFLPLLIRKKRNERSAAAQGTRKGAGENGEGVYIVTNQKPPSLFQLSDWQVGPPKKANWERERAHYEP